MLESELGQDDRLHPVAVADSALGCREYVVCLKERRNLTLVQAFLALASAMSPAVAGGALKAAEFLVDEGAAVQESTLDNARKGASARDG